MSEPTLPPPPDESDVGWGERVEDDDEALRRLLADRPPHHDR
jgi:hypothetical protein